MTTNPARLYKTWHWGLAHGKQIHWNDADLPPGDLIEIGRLAEITIRNDAGATTLRVGSPSETWPIGDSLVDSSHAAFDPGHKYRRIYLLLPSRVRDITRALWNPSAETWPLAVVAATVGGKQLRGYPNISVQPVGILLKLGYLTEKGSDGMSVYVHRMGEDGGIPPVICVDSTGRLWLAGGSYTCPTPGITQ